MHHFIHIVCHDDVGTLSSEKRLDRSMPLNVESIFSKSPFSVIRKNINQIPFRLFLKTARQKYLGNRGIRGVRVRSLRSIFPKHGLKMMFVNGPLHDHSRGHGPNFFPSPLSIDHRESRIKKNTVVRTVTS